jgi:NADPH:quinone reductase
VSHTEGVVHDMRAVRVHRPGGPQALQTDRIETPTPAPGEVRVRLAIAGVNFIDTYHRSGAYPLDLPATLGVEAAGEVDALGPGVDGVAVGDRVAYVGGLGAYAEAAVVSAAILVPIPEGVSDEAAAAVLEQGLTAHYLSRSTATLGAGDTVLVLAAAGGVGHLLVQMAKLAGARVIGAVSTEAKANLALRDGCDDVVHYDGTDLAAEVRRLTDGRGVDVVYDSVGRTTFDASLDCLRPRGLLVLFGQSSGAVPPLDPQVLNHKGALFLTRPTLARYIATRDELLDRAHEVFAWLLDGSLHVRVDRVLPLEEAAEAHRSLEARETMGKVLLAP